MPNGLSRVVVVIRRLHSLSPSLGAIKGFIPCTQEIGITADSFEFVFAQRPQTLLSDAALLKQRPEQEYELDA
jgi:hypothetical protein